MRRISVALVAVALLTLAALIPASLTPVRALPMEPAPAHPAAPRSLPLQAGDKIPSACDAVITESANPDSLRLCEASDVTVTAVLTCPTALPIHMVFAIDRSKSMADPADSNSARIGQQVKAGARNIIDALDWNIPGTMVGVLSHGFRVTTQTNLVDDRGRAIGGVNAVRYDPGDIGEDPAKAIERAQTMLENAREGASPIEIIVLFGDGCDVTEPSCRSASRRAASAAKGAGINVIAICYKESTRANCTDYRSLASEPRFYFEGHNRVPRVVQDLESEGRNLQLDALQLNENLGPDVTYVPGSGMPDPRVGPARLEFTFAKMQPAQSITATYALSVSAEGALPIRADTSVLEMTDSLGRPRTVPIPVRAITVTGPCVEPTNTPDASPTPTEEPTPVPTDTPSVSPTPEVTTVPTAAPTDTPSPVPTTAPSEVYLPIILRNACKPEVVFTDVVLVIDASGSMTETTEPGGGSKLAAAKTAARHFVDLLSLGGAQGDRAAIVSFNDLATIDATLGAGRPTLHAAIDGITTAPGTRIDRALEAACSALGCSAPPGDNSRAIVLLTDGRPNPLDTADDAMARANEAKAHGVVIFTIGLGGDVDAALLEAIASEPDLYYPSPSADELLEIYARIVYQLPCPGGAIWVGH